MYLMSAIVIVDYVMYALDTYKINYAENKNINIITAVQYAENSCEGIGGKTLYPFWRDRRTGPHAGLCPERGRPGRN